MAAYHGASMLCYVTQKEHLGLPNENDVREGIVAHKIAAHAADVALGKAGAIEKDHAMSDARYAFDWNKQFELSFDPKKQESFTMRACQKMRLRALIFVRCADQNIVHIKFQKI